MNSPHEHPKHDSHQHHHEHAPKSWKPHLDWRLWAAVLMLAAMALYILSMDEALQPGGPAQPPMPADAP
jgi:hypothetical protein